MSLPLEVCPKALRSLDFEVFFHWFTNDNAMQDVLLGGKFQKIPKWVGSSMWDWSLGSLEEASAIKLKDKLVNYCNRF